MSVSYCIPLFNKERYIAAVLQAALAECAATGGEVIVYDDASTDGSRTIAAEFADRGAIRLIQADKNRGVFAATTRLVGEARQPFLRLVDADDVILPGSTAYLLAQLRRHQAQLAHGLGGQQGIDRAPDYACATAGPVPLRKLLRNMDFNLSAALVANEAAQAILPLPDLQISQDFCVALRLAKRGPLVRSDACVSLQPVSRDSGNSLSRRVAAMYRDICLILADECTCGIGRGDVAFAVRRQAGRCRRYFRRHVPSGLGMGESLFLARCHLAHRSEPAGLQADRLLLIAQIFARDADRVLS